MRQGCLDGPQARVAGAGEGGSCLGCAQASITLWAAFAVVLRGAWPGLARPGADSAQCWACGGSNRGLPKETPYRALERLALISKSGWSPDADRRDNCLILLSWRGPAPVLIHGAKPEGLQP
jgi:hypothetical protein